MRSLISLLVGLVLAGVAGCTQPAAPAPGAAQSSMVAAQSDADQPASADAAKDPTPAVIPQGAQYTLYCWNVSGPTHVPDSDRLKNALIRRTGSKNWYVLHSDSQSILYYGYYKTFNDDGQPMEKARAQSDRRAVAQLRDNSGGFPFSHCFFVPLSSPDPQAPPEWDLRNAPGYWSLQIAAYTGSPDRKKFAVDAVRQARAMGIPAYYFHGPTISSVCIGAWPREAVKEQDSSVASSDDPNKTIVVLPAPLPPGTKTDNLFTADGHPAKVMAPRIEVQDPTLQAAMRQYPSNAVNGQVFLHKMNTDHGLIDQPDPSFLVVIPQPDDQTPSGPAGNGG